MFSPSLDGKGRTAFGLKRAHSTIGEFFDDALVENGNRSWELQIQRVNFLDADIAHDQRRALNV